MHISVHKAVIRSEIFHRRVHHIYSIDRRVTSYLFCLPLRVQCSWIPEAKNSPSERTLDEYSYEELKTKFCFAWLKPFVVDKSAAYYDEVNTHLSHSIGNHNFIWEPEARATI